MACLSAGLSPSCSRFKASPALELPTSPLQLARDHETESKEARQLSSSDARKHKTFLPTLTRPIRPRIFLNSGSTPRLPCTRPLVCVLSPLLAPPFHIYTHPCGDHASRRLFVVVVVVRLGNDVRSSAFLSFCAVRWPPRSSPPSRLESRSGPGPVVARSHLCRLAGGRARPGPAVLPSTRKAVPPAEIWTGRRGVPCRYAGSLSSLSVQFDSLVEQY